MKDFALKLRLLFLPYLIITVILAIVYTLLHWLIVIRGNVTAINENIIYFALPTLFAFICVLAFLRLRLLLIDTSKSWSKDPIFFWQLVLTAAIAVPIMVLQVYLPKSTGKLTQLYDITQIDNPPKTKYYSFNKYFFAKNYALVNYSSDVSGRHNEHFNMYLYITCPLLANAASTNDTFYKAWVCYRFSKSISNNAERAEKTAAFDAFEKEEWKKFQENAPDQFSYLERIGNTYDYRYYKESLAYSEKYDSTTAPILFTGEYEPFESRTGDMFNWIFYSWGIGAGIWFIVVMLVKLKKNAVSKFLKGERQFDREFVDAIALFIPHKDFWITPVLLNLNLLIYAIMFFCGLGFISFETSDLVKWGACSRPLVVNGAWWRLSTSTFLHGGLLHILMNMVGLFLVSSILEPLIGSVLFLSGYLLTGIGASLASIWWHQNTVSVGASGAIFGICGVVVALITTNLLESDERKGILLALGLFMGPGLLFGFFTNNVDNAAHLGGLASGIVYGYVIYFAFLSNYAAQGRTMKLRMPFK